MNAESTQLLLRTEVRCFLKGKVLKRLYGLHEELFFLLKKRKVKFKDLFSRDEKLNQIANLADAFGLLNKLSHSLQGHNAYIIDLYDTNKCFEMKVDLLLPKLRGKKTYMFPIVADLLKEISNVAGLNESLLSEMKVHMLSLKEEL
jgi:hypothetical protein